MDIGGQFLSLKTEMYDPTYICATVCHCDHKKKWAANYLYLASYRIFAKFDKVPTYAYDLDFWP